MTSSIMHKKHDNFGIVLNTGHEIIHPVQHDDFKLNIHIRDGEKSMIYILTTRTNTSRKVASISSFKTRKMIAKGIIMSNIITIYGSCS